MKKLVVVSSLLFLMVNAFAQDKENEDTYLFIKPSLNLGAARIKSSGNTFNGAERLGYGIGAEIFYPLAKKVVIMAGAGFNSRGYKDVRVMYFDVPVSINFVVKSFTLGGGAYYGMALSGSYKNVYSDWTKMKFGGGTTANRSRTDYGYLVNMGYNSGVFFFMASYMGSTKNVIPKDRQAAGNYIKPNCVQGSIFIPIKNLTHKK